MTALRRELRRFAPGNVRRRWGKRCDACGRRGRLGEPWHSYGGERVWHDVCMSVQHWRNRAEERLAVLELVAEVWEINAATVRDLASLRGVNDLDSSKAWDLAWRVFYDLDKRKKASA
jgi:hypothetical protein